MSGFKTVNFSDMFDNRLHFVLRFELEALQRGEESDFRVEVIIA